MAPRLTPLALRTAVREAILACGGHGFVRFGPENAPLLLTDAAHRMTAEQYGAFEARILALGLIPRPFEKLTGLDPSDDLLWLMGKERPDFTVDWKNDMLLPVATLGSRWAEKPPLPPDDGGRRVLLNTARLVHLPPDQLLRALPSLRAAGAERQRLGKLSGMREAGDLLLDYCLTHTLSK